MTSDDVADEIAQEWGVDISEEAADRLPRPVPIPLEEGDGDWRITDLDWYFE